jgi:hypothetical protein
MEDMNINPFVDDVFFHSEGIKDNTLGNTQGNTLGITGKDGPRRAGGTPELSEYAVLLAAGAIGWIFVCCCVGKLCLGCAPKRIVVNVSKFYCGFLVLQVIAGLLMRTLS